RADVLCLAGRRVVSAAVARGRPGRGAEGRRRSARTWPRRRRLPLGARSGLMEIRKVGVVGLGTMGAGIAQLSVQSGFDTVGREVSDELAQRGRGTIERYLTRGVEKGRLSQAERDAALGRLTLTTELAD